MKFMDFCAGIGGGRLGLEQLGMECVGFSEIDKKAENTYRLFFGSNDPNYGDLMKVHPLSLPDFDLLVAGFPCQAFSIVGQRQGLIDKRGQIIFGILKILKTKKIKYFILENVKGILSHNNGQTFKTILDLLESQGYRVIAKTLDSSHYGVPHKRERVYFIGIRKDLINNLNKFYSYFHQYPKKINMNKISKYLIDKNNIAWSDNKSTLYKTFLSYLKNKYNRGVFSVHDLLKKDFLIIDTRQSDLRLYREAIPTLRTGRHGLLYVKNHQFRRLSGYESLLLQGFPHKLAIRTKGKVLENQILSQSGNAMTINVVYACGESLLNFIKTNIYHNTSVPLKAPHNSLSNLAV